MSLNETDIGFAIQGFITQFLAGNLNTAMPGKVISYDDVRRVVDIKPMLRKACMDGTQQEFPVLSSVPVAVYGTKGAGVKLPIAAGDYVLLIFSQRQTDDFFNNGQINNTQLSRQFHLSDAVALPGLFPQSWNEGTTGSGDIQIYNNGGKVTVTASGDIELGEAFLSSLVKSSFISIFNAHVHTGGTISGSTGIPVNLSTLDTTLKVKAE